MSCCESSFTDHWVDLCQKEWRDFIDHGRLIGHGGFTGHGELKCDVWRYTWPDRYGYRVSFPIDRYSFV